VTVIIGGRARDGKMSDLFDYYWRVLRRAVSLAFSWNRDSLMNLIPVVLTLLLEVDLGWLDASKFAHEAGAQTLFIVLALITYFIPALLWAPVALDREWADAIAEKQKQLGDGVTLKVDRVSFDHPTPSPVNTRMQVNVTVSTGNARATLHSWALRSEATPTLKPVLSYLWWGHHRNLETVTLEEHDRQTLSLSFDFMGVAQSTEDYIRKPEHKWTLHVEDAHRLYSCSIVFPA